MEEDDGVENKDLLWRLLDFSWLGVVAGEDVARMFVLKTGTGVEAGSLAEAADLSAAEDLLECFLMVSVSAAKVSALVVFLAGTSKELELELESEEGDLLTGLGAGIGGLPAKGPVGRSITRSGAWFDVLLTLGVVLEPQPGLALSSPGLLMLLLSHRSFLLRKLLLLPPPLLVVELLLSLLSRLSCLLALLAQLFCFSTTPPSASSGFALATDRGRAPRETGDLAPSRADRDDFFLSESVTGDLAPSVTMTGETLFSVTVTGDLAG